MLTEDILRKMWPKSPRSRIQAVARVSDDVFNEFDVTTPLRVAHLMAQISHENNAGTATRENMNYRADRIMQVFGVGRHSAAITQAEAARLAGNPRALAERVYGLGNPKKAKELGNTQPGDGYRYRGNGDMQTTGRGGHRRVSELTGIDVESNPEMMEDPAISFRVAVAEFVALRCLAAADQDNIGLVTKRINGGSNGLAERKVWLRRWKDALDGLEEPPKMPRGAEPQAPKPLMSSKIAQGTAASTGLGIAGGSIQVANYLQTASDAASTARDTVDNVGNVVSVAKPLFLGMPIGAWVAISGACFLGAVIAAGYAFWQRRNKLYDEGV